MDALNLGTIYASLELRTSRLESEMARANANFNKFGKDITRTAEKAKREISQSFNELGRTLSLSLTAPLAALGVAAIKAATDMDSLKRGLTAVTGNAQETERQLVRLREVAKLPGLGFKEAVQGSINLQSAGFSAQEAEKHLKAFGNALATVGKGKAELDLVNLALTQLANKTSGFGQEIRQLQEHLPQVRKVMIEAFGTADSEIIANAGITGKQFVDIISAHFAKLPAVLGGAKNSFENFSDSAGQALAKIGDVFLPAVTRALDAMNPYLEKIAQGFSDLPGPAQSALGALAISGALMAPALLGLSALVKAIQSVRDAWIALKASGWLGIVPKAGPIAVLAGGAAAYGNMLREGFNNSQQFGGNAATAFGMMGTPGSQGFANLSQKLKGKTAAEQRRTLSIGELRMLEQEPISKEQQRIAASMDAAKMAEEAKKRKEAEKEAKERAKQFAKDRAEALKQFDKDMATFRNKFSGMRVQARQDFMEKVPLLGITKASDWLKARFKEIDQEEAEEKKRLDEGLKRKIEQAKNREEKLQREIAKSNKTVKEQEAEAIKEVTDRALGSAMEIKFDKEQAERRAKNFEEYLDQQAAEKLKGLKFLRFDYESGKKPIKGVPDEYLINPTAGQDTEENVRTHVSDLAKMTKKANAELEKEAELTRRKLRRTLGGSLGVELAYGITDGLAKTLEKAFGKSSIGQIFARGLMRWIDREMDNFTDSLFDRIGGALGKKGPASSSAGLGNTIAQGEHNGLFGGGLGQSGAIFAQLAGIASLKGKKQRNSILGSLLGFGIGSLGIPGVGQLLGSTIGGIFGGLFADGGIAPGRKISLVGERGPELIMPASATRVVPNHMLGGTSVHAPITVHAQVSSDYDVERMADTLQRRIERNIRLAQPVRVSR